MDSLLVKMNGLKEALHKFLKDEHKKRNDSVVKEWIQAVVFICHVQWIQYLLQVGKCFSSTCLYASLSVRSAEYKV